MRATRDLLRRRTYFVRRRADLLAHIQNTNAQYNLPAFGKGIARKIHREGLSEAFSDKAVQYSIDVDVEVIDHLDLLIEEVSRHIGRTARGHNPQALALLRTVPGIGKTLALVILYARDPHYRLVRDRPAVLLLRPAGQEQARVR